MTSVAQHIVAAVEQSVTDGALPESTTCEVNHEGRMVIEVLGKVRATIRPFLLRFSGPGAASFEYSPITATMPPGPPFVADVDGPAVWHFDWEANEPRPVRGSLEKESLATSPRSWQSLAPS